MIIDQNTYQKAFDSYLRKGTPIELSIKQNKSTGYYIWRTRGDNKVRSSHAAHDGKVFAWNNPPSTGHPGEGFGCRCKAEPYVPTVSESLNMQMIGVTDTGRPWTNRDFINHYRHGNGAPVRVRDIGHLQKIVNEYWGTVSNRLIGQIADAARIQTSGQFSYPFTNSYQMQHIVFSIGDTTIEGEAKARVAFQKDGTLRISGDCGFELTDEFADPLDIGIELPGGTPYPIFDSWSARISGRIVADRNKSWIRFDG